MIGASASTNLPKYLLYDFELLPINNTSANSNKVILKATLTKDAKGCDFLFDEAAGDDTFDLSAVIGNDGGKLKWGSSGFQQSAKNIRLDCTIPDKRRLVVDLQSSATGCFTQQSLNLDEHFTLVEYVHPYQKAIYYRLWTKEPPPPVRSLVLCFDGTSNQFSNQNTNVVKLMELLKKNDPDRQLVYYQTGVGTYAPPGWLTSVGLSVATTADKGFASFLYQHVIDGYKFLMETYQAGDRISIFGFSRGAFTARALAGMVHCVGLLPKHNIEHVPFAYEVYKHAKPKSSAADKTSHADDSTSTSKMPSPGMEEHAGALLSNNKATKAKRIDPENFKQTFCISVAIDFVGVWDTVASVGSLWPKTLPWVDYNPSIRNFRQALALDENRANFIPSVWDHSKTDTRTQTALEVWFKGQHTDIGGGAVPKRQPGGEQDQSMLSNISLRWMVRQCFATDTGIIFDHRVLKKYRNAKVLEERPPRGKDESALEYENRLLRLSEELDKQDIKYTPYDAMKEYWAWHFLEFLPTSKPTQTKAELSTTRRPNLYKSRAAYCPESPHPVAIHWSVVN
ncbi:hypothetical protein FS749_011201, partial [Ceratobasidium sp. UAMH 11750]